MTRGPWVKLDCGLGRNRKVRRLSTPARYLYVLSILHCGDELTDGHIDPSVLPQLLLEVGHPGPVDNGLVEELEAEGLWKPARKPRVGWQIPDYLDYNPSREWWKSQRERNARRQAEWRERHKESNPLRNGDSDHDTNEVSVTADVTRRSYKGFPKGSSRGGKCPECGLDTRGPQHLAQHLEIVHGQGPVPPCPSALAG